MIKIKQKILFFKNPDFLENKKSGFTLIELMVATSIFTIVMLVAMGSLLITSDVAKKSYNLNFTMDNLSFAVESMSRSMRMGINYTCSVPGTTINNSPTTSDCINGNSKIAFIPAGEGPLSTVRISYEKSPRGDGTNTIKRCITDGINTTCVELISPDIDIDTLKFFTEGSNINDLIQPSIYLILKGSATFKEKVTSFAIQTMISQRTFE